MVLLIDNYDSFSYNLYQYIGSIVEEIKVIRNDEMTIKEIEALQPSHIVISPGPGKPKDAGICEEVIAYFAGKVPILGVCLGHQAICEVFHATVSYAPKLMHGKQSMVAIDTTKQIFEGLAQEIPVARYHSLIALNEDFPSELEVIAKTKEDEIMAVKHKTYEIYGLQFHPESILTPDGRSMLENFFGKKSRDMNAYEIA